jgi:hypothetical protein
VDLAELARCSAPVLWLSSSEFDGPLALPGAIFDRSAKESTPRTTTKVVYYEVVRFSNASFSRTEVGDRLSPTGNGELVLRYLLYFPEDAAHLHDLERFDVYLRSVHDLGNDVWLFWPERVVGHAHGNIWYSNILRLQRHMVPVPPWPPTVFVEYQKHGIAPDADANGVFVPYIDVNVSASDAWGVRDSLGSKVGFLAPEYVATMTLPRTPASRLTGAGYELRRFAEDAPSTLCRCDKQPQCAEDKTPFEQRGWNLCAAVRDAVAAESRLPVDANALNWSTLSAIPGISKTMGAGALDAISLSAGRDQRQWRVTWVPRAMELSFLSGWVVPKARWLSHVDNRPQLQLTLGYTPSAGRWADYYVDIGYAGLRSPPCDGCGMIVELGYRWKAPTGVGLAGGRLGVAADYSRPRDATGEATGDRRFDRIRLVYDVTIGPW